MKQAVYPLNNHCLQQQQNLSYVTNFSQKDRLCLILSTDVESVRGNVLGTPADPSSPTNKKTQH